MGAVMTDFSGCFGDTRRPLALARLEQAMISHSSVVVRRLGADRAGEMSAHRVLSAPAVTVAAIVGCLARQTAEAAAGRRVVVAQDTMEVNFPGHHSKRLGGAGRLGTTPGFFLHGAVAIEAETQTMLGVVEAAIWHRDGAPATDRRKRHLEAKESQRWLRTAHCVEERLAGAGERIVVGDSESDIYALMAGRPAGTHLIVRCAQNRALADGRKLFEAMQAWPVLGCQQVKVAPRGPGDAGRLAQIVLRAGSVTVRAPRNGLRRDEPARLQVQVIEAVEPDPPEGVAPLQWRLLTTLPGTDLSAAREAVRLYRLRWRIEQCFRMFKSDGLKFEEAQTADTHRLFNLAALAIGAAVRIIQLVDARDGSARPASDVANPAQVRAAMALCPSLEGKTARQRNPYPAGGLDWLSWIIARLGGWNCYYKPPGPKTMRQGWDRFAAIAQGFELATAAQTPA